MMISEAQYKFEGLTLDAERRLLTDGDGSVIDITPKGCRDTLHISRERR
jgi:hypothetical protein